MVKYVIHGAGAIGSAMGGSLAKAGFDVTLVSRKEHVNAIVKQKGLYLHTLMGTILQPIQACVTMTPSLITEKTVIFQTMKANDTQTSLKDLANVSINTPIVCWQNGVDNERVVATVFKNIYGGIVRFTATMMTPGTVEYAGSGKLIIGSYPKGMDPLVDMLVNDLNKTGLTTLKSNTIMQDKWLKLLVNLISCIKPITVKNEGERDTRITICRHVLEEGISVLKKAGIKAVSTNNTEDSPEDMLLKFAKALRLADGEGQGMKLLNSTWQSLAKKKKDIENDFYTGTIIKLGEKHRISTPYNRAILYYLHTIAQNGLGPESIEVDAILSKAKGFISDTQ